MTGVSSFVEAVSFTAAGGSLTAVTVIVTVAVSLEVPSEIVYVNESEPLKLAFGV